MRARTAGRVAGMVALVGAVLAVVGVLTFAGPCVHEDGSPAGCTGASHVILGAGIVAATLSIVALAAFDKPKMQGISAFLAAVAGAVMAFAPGNVVGLCMMQTMRCWTIMRPYALMCGIVIAVASVICAALALRSSGK